jgi:uncharacterized protein YxjI
METLHLLVLAVVSVGALACLGWLPSTGTKKKRKKEAKESTRWNVFHLHFDNLHKKTQSAAMVIDGGPKSTKLFRKETGSSERHFVLTDSEDKHSIRLDRGFLFSRHRLQIAVDNQPILAVQPGRKGTGTPKIEFAKKAYKCSLHGDVKDREFELRRDNRLVAIVSRRAAATVDGARDGCYRIETLKGEKTLPLLGVLLGLEVALGKPPAE